LRKPIISLFSLTPNKWLITYPSCLVVFIVPM
jgi:hypothetical protein